MTDLAIEQNFNLSGKLGDKVFGITDGVQWVRAYFIPPNPETVIQQNNRHAFRLCSLLFSALTGSMRTDWIELSEKRYLPKPNFFVKRGMLSYINQLGVDVYADSVDVSGVYPDDVWDWTPA